MADNVQISEGAGKVIAGDDVGGVIYQRIKVAHGADGTATDTSTAAPLPVEDANSDALLAAAQAIETAVEGTLTVSGSVTVSSAPTTAITAAALPLPSGAATSAKQDTEIGHLATLAGAVTGTEMQVDVLTMPGITLGASEDHLGEIGGRLVTVSAEMTRPADTTAYTAGDVVSNSTSSTTPITLANAVRVNAGSGYIVRVEVTTDKKSITPRLRVHFFNVNNPTVSVDNAAHQEKYADIGKYIGFVDTAAMATGTDTTNSDMSRGVNDSCRLPIVAAAATRNIYAVLQALDAFTPANAEKFTLSVTVDNN